MKEIKEKPTKRVPRSNAAGKIPKAALKKAWTEAKEKSRTKLRESISTQGEGNFLCVCRACRQIVIGSHKGARTVTDATFPKGNFQGKCGAVHPDKFFAYRVVQTDDIISRPRHTQYDSIAGQVFFRIIQHIFALSRRCTVRMTDTKQTVLHFPLISINFQQPQSWLRA